MAIERRNPQKNLAAREMNEAGEYFEDVFGRHLLPETWRKNSAEDSVWAPSIEVIENKDDFMVKVEPFLLRYLTFPEYYRLMDYSYLH